MYTEMYSDNLLCLTIRKALCLLARVRASQPFYCHYRAFWKFFVVLWMLGIFPLRWNCWQSMIHKGWSSWSSKMEGGVEKRGKLKLNRLWDLVEVKLLLSLSLVVIIGLFSDYEDFKSPPNIMIKIFPPSGNMAERLSSLSSPAKFLYCHEII